MPWMPFFDSTLTAGAVKHGFLPKDAGNAGSPDSATLVQERDESALSRLARWFDLRMYRYRMVALERRLAGSADIFEVERRIENMGRSLPYY